MNLVFVLLQTTLIIINIMMSISLFSLVILSTYFNKLFFFLVFFLQRTQYVSIVFIWSKIKRLYSFRFHLLSFLRRLFDVSKYFSDSFKNVKVFFFRINSNKLTTKFLFYCFLPFYFIFNISVALFIFINFYCKLIVMKI